jgi:lipoprotein NlpI
LAWTNKGDADKAIADYDTALGLDPKMTTAYSWRGSAWADKGDNDRAIADYTEAIKLDPKDSGNFAARGMVYIYFNEQSSKAQADLEQAVTLKPDEPYSVIWRELAERRTGTPSHLREATGKLDMTNWPAPVVRMLLGDKTPAETLAAAEDPNPATRQGQVCEVNFYTAELDRLQGHAEDALRLYGLAASSCPKDFFEHRAATMALRALGAAP